LTETAARRVSNFIAKRDKGVGMRLGVRTTGCSDMAYKLEFADGVNPDDTLFESHGVKVIVDPKSLPYLEGTELDFAREGPQSGTDLMLNELRACGVDACGPIRLNRVESRHFDDTDAPVTALLPSCQDAPSQVRERREGRQKAVCIARATPARARSTNAPIATWPNCDQRGGCSGCSKSASSIAS
jgi:iron-sulfur cluster assembly protein